MVVYGYGTEVEVTERRGPAWGPAGAGAGPVTYWLIRMTWPVAGAGTGAGAGAVTGVGVGEAIGLVGPVAYCSKRTA